MRHNTVRLNITLPKDLVESLDRVAGYRRRSRFIEEALDLRIKQKQKEALDRLLTEGYKAAKKESIELSTEFQAADLEGWDEY